MMCRRGIISPFILGVLLFVAPLRLLADQVVPPAPTIIAPVYHYDAASDTVAAEGGVLAEFSGITLSSSELTADLAHQSLAAPGKVEVAGPQFKLEGENLTYDLLSRSGILLNPVGEVTSAPSRAKKAQNWPLLVRGEKIVLSYNTFTLSQGRFTLCDAEKPHFWLKANRLVIAPGKSATLYSGSLSLYGHDLIHYPKYTLSLKGKPQLPVPIVGFNKGWGAHAGFSAPLLGGRAQVAVASRGGLVGKWGAGGEVKLGSGSPLEWEAAVGRREDAKDPFNSALLLNLYPLVFLETTEGRLGTLTATLGRIEELPTRVLRNKAGIRWLGPGKEVALGDATLTLTPQLWHNWYAGGQQYSVAALEVELKSRLGPGRTLSLAYVHNAVGGTTPFQYDDVNIKRELRPGLEWRLAPKWGVDLAGRYDVDKGEFADDSFTVNAIQHCLTYSLEWRKARGQFNLSVGLSARE